MSSSDSWVVEFSHSLKQLRTETLAKSIQRNVRNFITEVPSDWILLGIFPSRPEAQSLLNQLDPENTYSKPDGTVA